MVVRIKFVKGIILFLGLIGILSFISCLEDDGPQNEVPSISNQSFSIPETAQIGAEIGTVQATDRDGDNLVFSITSGNEDATFALNSTSGELTLISTLDFDLKSTYVLVVEVNDGRAFSEGTVTISVLPSDNEEPTMTTQSFEINEVSPVGSEVGVVQAEDVDGDDLFFSIISGNTNETFSIGASSGLLVIDKTLNFQTDPSYTLTIEVSDGKASITGTVTIEVLEGKLIWEILDETSDLSEFKTILERFPDLKAQFEDESQENTLFVPNNQAMQTIYATLGISNFDAIKNEIVKQVAEYHILTTSVLSSNFTEVLVTLQGEDIQTSGLSLTTGATSDSEIIDPDVLAKNGILHVVDVILIPPTVGSSMVATLGTLGQPIYLSADFSILEAAIKKSQTFTSGTDLWEQLVNTANNLTVFAPTDATFYAAALTIDSFTAEEWHSIIANHFLIDQGSENSTIGASDMSSGASFTTLAGGSLLFLVATPSNGLGIYIDSDGDVDLSDPNTYTNLDAEVVVVDVFSGSNGRMHVIAGILAPQ